MLALSPLRAGGIPLGACPHPHRLEPCVPPYHPGQKRGGPASPRLSEVRSAGKAPTSCSSRLGYGEAATASVGQDGSTEMGWCGRSHAGPWGQEPRLPGHQGLVRTLGSGAAPPRVSRVRFTRPRWPPGGTHHMARKRFSRLLRVMPSLQSLRKHAGLWGLAAGFEPRSPLGS